MEDLKIIIKGKELTQEQVNVFYQMIGAQSYLKGYKKAIKDAKDLGVDEAILKGMSLEHARYHNASVEKLMCARKECNYPEFEK